jgi:hypothetical protein
MWSAIRDASASIQRDILSLANAEQDAYLAAVAAVNASGWPDYPVATVRPGSIPAYFGEGSSLYAAGLGTVSLCPSPTYLLQAGGAQQPQLLDLDKLDQRLMYGQILAYAQTIGALDAVPASVPGCAAARRQANPRRPGGQTGSCLRSGARRTRPAR